MRSFDRSQITTLRLRSMIRDNKAVLLLDGSKKLFKPRKNLTRLDHEFTSEKQRIHDEWELIDAKQFLLSQLDCQSWEPSSLTNILGHSNISDNRYGMAVTQNYKSEIGLQEV